VPRRPGLIDASGFQPGAVVIDVGINRVAWLGQVDGLLPALIKHCQHL
jgi:5,10-methylene-tetrahydrofolate dehydrogenase/methenyl tetrahydrofolate cyclohydrolase